MHRFIAACLAFAVIGCNPPSAKKAPPAAPQVQKPAQPRPKPPEKPAFDEQNMTRPIDPPQDYQKLPNCLDILAKCNAVPFEGKTSEQYKSLVTGIAKVPCRVVLKLVDVHADYDFAKFDLLKDDGTSALEELKAVGNLTNYERYLKFPLAINDAKKKGLAKGRSIGDRIVLVGLGDVVDASGWGAASPYKGMPRGDERQVMLRAFGKPNGYHPSDYEFAFMVRNWYIAYQGAMKPLSN